MEDPVLQDINGVRVRITEDQANQACLDAAELKRTFTTRTSKISLIRGTSLVRIKAGSQISYELWGAAEDVREVLEDLLRGRVDLRASSNLTEIKFSKVYTGIYRHASF